ncbi:hypothetical protein D5366_04550 [Neokomagataea tanensis]|uniref:Uncharacterized protein n=1 Tax=Neokomagataea tanensis TaxID=661191 RepID=A0A4Y6V825_9PROT|nr:hypothetical protein D5366_04550 [Neokomagataea tanensis]
MNNFIIATSQNIRVSPNTLFFINEPNKIIVKKGIVINDDAIFLPVNVNKKLYTIAKIEHLNDISNNKETLPEKGCCSLLDLPRIYFEDISIKFTKIIDINKVYINNLFIF